MVEHLCAAPGGVTAEGGGLEVRGVHPHVHHSQYELAYTCSDMLDEGCMVCVILEQTTESVPVLVG
jgi:hypothetical protein